MRRGPRLNPEALRAARVRAGLTQHELARLVGVAGGERVSRWELGTSRPRPEILLRVAAGLSMRDLAVRAHVSKTTLGRWESGGLDQTPSRAALALLALPLGVPVDEVERAIVRSRSRQQPTAT